MNQKIGQANHSEEVKETGDILNQKMKSEEELQKISTLTPEPSMMPPLDQKAMCQGENVQQQTPWKLSREHRPLNEKNKTEPESQKKEEDESNSLVQKRDGQTIYIK